MDIVGNGRETRSFNYYWRVFATGFSFFIFGVGGLFIGLLVFPLINLVVWDRDKKTIIGQRLIHKLFRLFVEMMCSLGIMTYEIQGLEKLQKAQGTLIVANHPTLIDVVVLIAFLPKVDCVVKAALMKNPVMIGPVKAADYIVNSNPEKLITDCAKRIEKGNALIIFPEGTRTTPGQPLKFQRGAAGIALESGADITPVVIRCEPSTLTKAEKWYQIPPRKFAVSVTVKDTIKVAELGDASEPRSLANRRLTQYLQDYFTKEIT